jgi:hypothetical protein
MALLPILRAAMLTCCLGFPSAVFPIGTSFGAFARPSSGSGLDFFVIFQDAQGIIKVVQRLDTAAPQWEPPRTYSAFDGADKGSGVACLTPSGGGLDAENLQLGGNMTRCYFQVNRMIQEVLLRDNNFVKVGVVPTG